LAAVTTIYLARVLGAANFGVIEIATAVLIYAELIVQAGFTRLGPREIARDESRLPHLVQTILTLRLLLVAAALPLTALFALSWANTPTDAWVVLLYGLSLFAVALDADRMPLPTNGQSQTIPVDLPILEE
jgi:O-antigen/teichoic acid export membrane protein